MPVLTVPAIMDAQIHQGQLPSVKNVRCYLDDSNATLYFSEPVYGVFIDTNDASEDIFAFCDAVEAITDHFGEMADAYVGSSVSGKILADWTDYFFIAFATQEPSGSSIPLQKLEAVGWEAFTPFTGFTLEGYEGYDGYKTHPVDLTFTPDSLTVSEPTCSVDLDQFDADPACADQIPAFFARMALLSLPEDDQVVPIYDAKGNILAYMVWSRYLDFVAAASEAEEESQLSGVVQA